MGSAEKALRHCFTGQGSKWSCLTGTRIWINRLLGKNFIFRTAAGFVKCVAGVPDRPLLSRSEMILRGTESAEAGYLSSEDMQVFLGKEGVTSTVLRPTGMAEFDGVKLNVLSEGDFINAGVKVKIIRVDGSRVVVKPL